MYKACAKLYLLIYSKIKINPGKYETIKTDPSYISSVSGITNYSTGPVKRMSLTKWTFC